MNRRLSILLHWLRGRRNGVTTLELVRFLTSPAGRFKGRRLVVSLEETTDTYRVWLAESTEPLTWPKSIDLSWLYMVLAEQYHPTDWHYYEIPETRVVTGDVVVDCGAGEGLFTFRVAGRAERVFAVEPLPMWVACLHQTFQKWDNVEILPYALSNQNGTDRIQPAGLLSKLNDQGVVEVQVKTIDDLFGGRGVRVTYIKADLEGHDLRMLQGAKHTILRHSPLIAVTTYHEPAHADLMMRFLRGLNPRYRFKLKGIEAQAGGPVMLHAWI